MIGRRKFTLAGWSGTYCSTYLAGENIEETNKTRRRRRGGTFIQRKRERGKRD